MMRKAMLVLAVLAIGAMVNADIVNYWDCESIDGSAVPANIGPGDLAVWGAGTTVSADAKWGDASIDSPTGAFLATSNVQNDLLKGTFATWVKSTDSGNAWKGLLTTNIKGNVSTNMRIEIGASPAQLYIWDIPNIAGTGTNYIVPTVNLNDGEWHFLVLTYDKDAGVCNFYADGVLDGSVEYGTANATKTGSFQVGSKNLLTGSSSGLKIDETAIFDTALTLQEVEYYNTNPMVPEPATMSLLLAGGLVGLIRRKKVK